MTASRGPAHLIGIGGSGMSGLARILHGLGYEVTGSDDSMSPHIDRVRELGISVSVGPRRECSVEENALVIRSAAIPEQHPELVAARAGGNECRLYAEALGDLSREIRTVAVAGTHGKTSTTALTVAGMRAGGLDPSFLVGGHVPELGGNGFAGRSPYFVVESCEFNRSFHELRPYVAMLLNLEADHFDCYASVGELVASFAQFVAGVAPGGTVLAHESVPDEALQELPPGVRLHRVSDGHGADECEISARGLRFESGHASFEPVLFGRVLPRISLEVLGRFQASNALFALAAAAICEADVEHAARGIARFRGVNRRLEHFEMKRGPLLFDYAHHPSEIGVVLEAVRDAFPGRPIYVGFQPHQHSRTRHLFDDFAAALARADRCFLADIFAAREDPSREHGVCSEDLAQAIRAAGGSAEAVGPVEQLAGSLHAALNEAWNEHGEQHAPLPLVLGAGELDGVVQDLVRDG
jgi:UDP-N-acetylmuramate--alanine ligase